MVHFPCFLKRGLDFEQSLFWVTRKWYIWYVTYPRVTLRPFTPLGELVRSSAEFWSGGWNWIRAHAFEIWQNVSKNNGKDSPSFAHFSNLKEQHEPKILLLELTMSTIITFGAPCGLYPAVDGDWKIIWWLKNPSGPHKLSYIISYKVKWP